MLEYSYEFYSYPIEDLCSHWESWDFMEPNGTAVFFNCILSHDIEPFHMGDCIDQIYYSSDTNTVTFIVNQTVYEYPLLVSLGKPTVKKLETTNE